MLAATEEIATNLNCCQTKLTKNTKEKKENETKKPKENDTKNNWLKTKL